MLDQYSDYSIKRCMLFRALIAVRFYKALFWIALIICFVSAVMPVRHAVPALPWDKANHFLAFYILMLLATVAFPTRSLIWMAIGLSMFGAAIEFVQGLHFVGRDRDFWDWVADSVAIVAAQVPMILQEVRRHFVLSASQVQSTTNTDR